MKAIYTVLSIISLCYVLFKHRKIDFFTVYIFSILMYYFPAYLGSIYNSLDNYTEIIDKTYIVLCINLVIVLFIMFLYDLKKSLKTKIKTIDINASFYNNKTMFIIAIITLGFVIISIVQYGGVKGSSFNKMQLLAFSNRITEYTKYFATYVFVYGFTNSGRNIKFIRLIGVASILYTFSLGHRSFLVIGMICIIYNHLKTRYDYKCVFQIIKDNKKLVISLFLFGIFILFVKNVFAAFINGDYELVMTRLTNIEYYKTALLQSESNTIINNLNSVLLYDMKYDILSYFVILIASLIPVLGNVILNSSNMQSFEYMLQVNFNDYMNEGIGLGSTFLGESYSSGGYIFLLLMCFTVCLLIISLEKKVYSTSSPILRTWLMIFLSYLTFYISRNSLVFTLVTARSYLYILVLSWMIKIFIVRFYKRFGYYKA